MHCGSLQLQSLSVALIDSSIGETCNSRPMVGPSSQ